MNVFQLEILNAILHFHNYITSSSQKMVCYDLTIITIGYINIMYCLMEGVQSHKTFS